MYSNIALGKELTRSNIRKICETRWPTFITSSRAEVRCPGYPETTNVIMCVLTMKPHYEQEFTENWGRTRICDGSRRQISSGSELLSCLIICILYLKDESGLHVFEILNLEEFQKLTGQREFERKTQKQIHKNQ